MLTRLFARFTSFFSFLFKTKLELRAKELELLKKEEFLLLKENSLIELEKKLSEGYQVAQTNREESQKELLLASVMVNHMKMTAVDMDKKDLN